MNELKPSQSEPKAGEFVKQIQYEYSTASRSIPMDLEAALVHITRLEAEIKRHRWIPANQPPEKPFKVEVCNTRVGYIGHDRYLVEEKRWESGHDYTHWKPVILPLPEKEQADQKPFNIKNYPLNSGSKAVDNRNLRIGERCRGKKQEDAQ